ncbi:beta-glucoside-specific PTS transporter subunit IIABC [Neobacillus cucumis]|uniref:beta-glucoside-specific PTS transporter subunit IIABC n=1 Tax=Neobacillus cucumis TaxID=1740721 RepID=UPI0028531BC9|nr:beta-glucoside-specific PTS transporter subunit IIABC [Neobacillus cucumis]MDR4950320.1 beta-glucoside-specific PTS transporter subunit IIABC [Neobacillus cucumis]
MNHKILAQSVLEHVGGKDNIQNVIHCMTRLRLTLRNPSLANSEEISRLEGVLKVANAAGQYQIIIGNDVGFVYKELVKLIDIVPGSNSNVEQVKDNSLKGYFNRFANLITGIFAPIIPAIAGAGMLKALLVLLPMLSLMKEDSQTYLLLKVISDSSFFFLPMLLAYTSSQKFGTNPMVSIVLAGVLLHPNLTALFNSGKAVFFAGIPVKAVSYGASVIPIILIIWLMSYVEKLAEKLSPGPVKIFLKPLITIIIVAPIALTVLGPLGMYLGAGLAAGVLWIQETAGWAAVAILAVFLPFIIMFGMQKVFYPVVIASLAHPGYDSLIGVAMLASNMAQGAGSLAVSFKTKDLKLKQIALSGGISALFGITEPALYGVHLRLKKTLFACMIGAGISGIFVGILKLKAFVMVSPGIATMPIFIEKGTSNFTYAIIGALISVVVTFIAVYLIGFEDVKVEEVKQKDIKISAQKSENKVNRKVIYSPIKGEVIPLKKVRDKVFSEEVMGKGMAIKPTEGKVVAPFDGTVEMVFHTKHAIGLKSNLGVEVLIHIGIDTVNLNGQYFTSHVQNGDEVKQGQLLIEFDLKNIQKAGYDTTTPVVITNSADYLEILSQEEKTERVSGKQQPLLTVL